MTMRLEKIDRVVVAVESVEEAAKFFDELLGIKFDRTLVGEEQQVKAKASAIGLELVESTTPDGPVARFIDSRGEGVYAVIFKVPDLEDAISEMEGKGLRLVGTMEVGGLKEAMFHPKDSHGMMIMLCEYESAHSATIAATRGTSHTLKGKAVQ